MAQKPYPTDRIISEAEVEYISTSLKNFDKEEQGEKGCGVFLIYGRNPRSHVDMSIALLNLFGAQFEEVSCRRHFMWWTKEKRTSGINKIISKKTEYSKKALEDLNIRADWGDDFFYTESYAGYLTHKAAMEEERVESRDSAWRAADAMGTRPVVFIHVISELKENAVEFLDYAFPEYSFPAHVVGSLDCNAPVG